MIEFYSVIKKNRFMSFSGNWMELGTIMLSKISQTWEIKYHTVSLILQTPNINEEQNKGSLGGNRKAGFLEMGK